MQPLFYYCLKVIICSGILYGYYLLALRNNRFHQWNRWYLLGSVMLSFGLPFLQIPLPDFSEHPTAVSYSMQLLAAPDRYFAVRQPESYHLTWESAVFFAYLMIALCLLFIFFRQLRHIQLLKRHYKDEATNGIHFYLTTETGTPFSFFKNIFWNTGIDLHSGKGQQMLRHEMAHVTEWHSVDKLLLEIATALAFWNPFLYLIKKELSVVHEFIADQKAAANDDKLEYASLLLMKAMGSPQYTLGNPFFHSQLKRRIMMLTRSTNPRFSYVRRLLVLPLAAISLVLFSFKYKELKEKKQVAPTTQKEDTPVLILDEDAFDDGQDTTRKKVVIVVDKNYKGSRIKTITPTTNLSGAVVNTVDGNTYFLNRKEAATELNLVITDKGFTAPKDAQVIAYDANGVPPDIYSNVIRPDVQANERIVIGKPGKAVISVHLDSSRIGNVMFPGTNDASRQPLFILDGKEISEGDMKVVDPNQIESIDVLKDNSATAKYGEKGKNGVIRITLKKPFPDEALYILDGVESTKEKVEAINPATIRYTLVGKGEEAAKKYGYKGRNGVVEVVTKLAKDEVTFDDSAKVSNKEVIVTGYPIKERVVTGYPKKAGATPAQTTTGNTMKEVVVVGYSTKQDYDKVFTKVEVPAAFPGADDGWRRYIMQNLQYPDAARKNGTQGTVQVQLLVNEEGNITEIQPLNNPGNGLAEEAVRVIKNGPKWVPAKQNGRAVNYRFVQPITFQLQ